MKRYASNRVAIVHTDTILRNGVVEVDDVSHEVTQTFELDREIRQTEWKGGVILVCKEFPQREEEENFLSFMTRIQVEENLLETATLYAFHITAFNVSAMEFTSASRILPL